MRLDFDYEGARDIERAWREGLTPDPFLTVSEWADAHRVLSSKSASEPGRWRTSRTPYLREIMDCLSPASPVERVVFMKGSQIGAPLALDTPIPLVDGWTTMGEITVGDRALDQRGQPCRVIGVSEVLTGCPCFELRFDDGETIVCDAEHRWPVWDFTNDTPVAKTLRPAEMMGRLRIGRSKRYRYAIDCCAPLDLPPQDLIVHPYVVGVWLGDGASVMNHVSVHEDDAEIVDHLEPCGVTAVFRRPSWRKGRCANVVIDPTWRIYREDGECVSIERQSCFTERLRRLDLIDNKHIPTQYLRGSREQRLELVRGFMDTDGTISPDGKRCEFSNASARLVNGFVELLRSLGYKPALYWSPSRTRVIVKERLASACVGHWRVSWSAYREEPMFKLSRKTARMRSQAQARLSRSRRRRIVDLRPVRSVPVRCIEVNSPSHLYLCGKGFIPTHNTEAGNCWIGYVIHQAPGPMMAVSPTVEMAKRNSKQRVDPLIEESPILRALIAPARSRDSGNTILAKEFRGGVLVMTGANSAVGLRSMPVRYLFLDEMDGYPRDVEGEGDAIQLAEARTRTFARRKIFVVSTPTIAGASSIEREFEATDRRCYFVPCHHCGFRQWLKFERLVWEKGEPETARYLCEQCEGEIREHHKGWMLEHGEWRATAEAKSRKAAGFHLSSLYSPVGWRAWAEIAAAWEAAQGSATAIKTFKNTELGETWIEEGEAPDWERLLERREDYRIGTVPTGGLLLTGGADVQKDRIEVSVWAFGRGKGSWLVEHRVLQGDTARDAVWKRLAELIAERWTHESGAQLPLARFAIDTGFATQDTYAFVRGVKDPRVMAVKGVARGAALIGLPTAVDVTLAGKRLRRGVKVFAVASGIAKLELYNNLRKHMEIDEDGTVCYPAGYVHLPKVDAEYLKQLCAEQLVTRRDRNGFPVREWQKMRERNEALDGYVYARAAAAAAGLDRFEERHWRELERQLGIRSTAGETEHPILNPAPDGPAAETRTRPRRLIRSRWLGH